MKRYNFVETGMGFKRLEEDSDGEYVRYDDAESLKVPDGWQLVPKLLTPEMATELNLTGSFSDAEMQKRYSAALSKAPSPYKENKI